ncbi:uncharacterized protein LAESUDRAFT_211050 [Laetiporus sulphureus 93-53]|uniref:DUF6533 domain-containing protein n=1 Tax=Laetiporus sulphureus 93-53 TaxID=1314785 RepID=A0A165DVB9_9APHY|nr:uncharacterized protein LAESUDRAFT_211050 [Laetiporus sulphureus 93-53]KZT05699.1 hypothetical protein LAESUDRAFT_211050 [Laetiporus sulphureus 93-53]
MSLAASEAITLVEVIFEENYALIAGAALIFFDHVITFGQEVQLFWGERSFSAWLFFANRMLALVYASLSVWSVMNFYTVKLYGERHGEQCGLRFHCDNLRGGYDVTSIRRDRCLHCESYTSTASTMTLVILWRKLYVDHRPATADILSTRNPPLAALLLRDGTIQLTAILLLNLLLTVLSFVNSTVVNVVASLEYSLIPILVSRVLLNVRAAARSTRGEQSRTPSFVRSRRGVQTQDDVENMSFESNILNSTEQAPEGDRSHPQESIEHGEIVAELRSTANDVATAGDAQQDVNEGEAMDDEVEEEMLSDWEDGE